MLSVPGSSEHRIAPDDTGFANLYAVGDWTACVTQRRLRGGGGHFWDAGRERDPPRLTGTRATPSRSSGSRARRKEEDVARPTANHGDGRSTRCWPWPPRPRRAGLRGADYVVEGLAESLRRDGRRAGDASADAGPAGGIEAAAAAAPARSRGPVLPPGDGQYCGPLRRAAATASARRFRTSPPPSASASGSTASRTVPRSSSEGPPGTRRRSSSTSRTPAPRRWPRSCSRPPTCSARQSEIDAGAVSFSTRTAATHPPRRARSDGEGHRRGRDPRRGAGRAPTAA